MIEPHFFLFYLYTRVIWICCNIVIAIQLHVWELICNLFHLFKLIVHVPAHRDSDSLKCKSFAKAIYFVTYPSLSNIDPNRKLSPFSLRRQVQTFVLISKVILSYFLVSNSFGQIDGRKEENKDKMTILSSQFVFLFGHEFIIYYSLFIIIM